MLSHVYTIDAIDPETSAAGRPAPLQPPCHSCRDGVAGFPIELTMAFQPIVNVETRQVYAYEALVRGTAGESAGQVLSLVTPENRYIFDQLCRVKAIELAAKLGVAKAGARLAVNFMPGAVYSPAACIRRTLAVAREHDFPLDHIIFELMENEEVNTTHLEGISKEYSRHGFTLALDDFGAGYSGLNLLASLDGIGLVKLDGALIRAAGRQSRAAAIIAAMADLCAGLGILLLGECVETVEEYAVLRRCGVNLMQGYLFATPATAKLPEVHWPLDSYQSEPLRTVSAVTS